MINGYVDNSSNINSTVGYNLSAHFSLWTQNPKYGFYIFKPETWVWAKQPHLGTLTANRAHIIAL